jgi:hypothetical protein
MLVVKTFQKTRIVVENIFAEPEPKWVIPSIRLSVIVFTSSGFYIEQKQNS